MPCSVLGPRLMIVKRMNMCARWVPAGRRPSSCAAPRPAAVRRPGRRAVRRGVQVVEHRVRHLVAEDGERAVAQHLHEWGPARDGIELVILKRGIARGRAGVRAEELVDVQLGRRRLLRDRSRGNARRYSLEYSHTVTRGEPETIAPSQIPEANITPVPEPNGNSSPHDDMNDMSNAKPPRLVLIIPTWAPWSQLEMSMFCALEGEAGRLLGPAVVAARLGQRRQPAGVERRLRENITSVLLRKGSESPRGGALPGPVTPRLASSISALKWNLRRLASRRRARVPTRRWSTAWKWPTTLQTWTTTRGPAWTASFPMARPRRAVLWQGGEHAPIHESERRRSAWERSCSPVARWARRSGPRIAAAAVVYAQSDPALLRVRSRTVPWVRRAGATMRPRPPRA
jgi:hypothetical protein